MFRTIANAWKIKDLRSKILFTLAILFIYRIGANLFVPFISRSKLTIVAGNSAFGIFNILTGGAYENMTLFALGVSPYITASIVIQLLTVAIPALERLSKMGEEGKKKIAIITRYITLVISLIMAIGYYFIIRDNNLLTVAARDGVRKWLYAIVIIACFCAGSALVMWLAERINERGIGNGISLILFANIISTLPSLLMTMIAYMGSRVHTVTTTGPVFDGAGFNWVALVISIITIIVLLVLVWFIVFITDSERRIPVQYAKKVVGRKMYGGQNSNLPIKLNMTGVMPIIFANSIMSIPSLIAQFFISSENETVRNVATFMSGTGWPYVIIQFILVLAFAYFYVAISFNPIEVSGNLQKNGGSIPGIRPGKATSDYISKVLSRITLIGALALSIIAILPHVITLMLDWIPIHWAPNGPKGDIYSSYVNFSIVDTYGQIFQPIVMSGTSIIIVVGVILETIREIEAQMTMRHYKGFLE